MADAQPRRIRMRITTPTPYTNGELRIVNEEDVEHFTGRGTIESGRIERLKIQTGMRTAPEDLIAPLDASELAFLLLRMSVHMGMHPYKHHPLNRVSFGRSGPMRQNAQTEDVPLSPDGGMLFPLIDRHEDGSATITYPMSGADVLSLNSFGQTYHQHANPDSYWTYPSMEAMSVARALDPPDIMMAGTDRPLTGYREGDPKMRGSIQEGVPQSLSSFTRWLYMGVAAARTWSATKPGFGHDFTHTHSLLSNDHTGNERVPFKQAPMATGHLLNVVVDVDRTMDADLICGTRYVAHRPVNDDGSPVTQYIVPGTIPVHGDFEYGSMAWMDEWMALWKTDDQIEAFWDEFPYFAALSRHAPPITSIDVALSEMDRCNELDVPSIFGYDDNDDDDYDDEEDDDNDDMLIDEDVVEDDIPW